MFDIDLNPGPHSELVDVLLCVTFDDDGDVASHLLMFQDAEDFLLEEDGHYTGLVQVCFNEDGAFLPEASKKRISDAIDLLGECRDIDARNAARMAMA